MRSTWLIIHFCWRDFSILIPYLHDINNLFLTWNISFSNIPNEDTSNFILLNLKICLCCVEQVSEFFHIDFHHAHFYFKLYAFIWVLNLAEDSSHHSWYDTLQFHIFNVWTLHCESLSWPSLPICKYCSIKSFKNAFRWWKSYFL